MLEGELAQPTAREGRFLFSAAAAEATPSAGVTETEIFCMRRERRRDVAFTFVYLGFSIAKAKNFSWFFSRFFFLLCLRFVFFCINKNLHGSAVGRSGSGSVGWETKSAL